MRTGGSQWVSPLPPLFLAHDFNFRIGIQMNLWVCGWAQKIRGRNSIAYRPLWWLQRKAKENRPESTNSSRKSTKADSRMMVRAALVVLAMLAVEVKSTRWQTPTHIFVCKRRVRRTSFWVGADCWKGPTAHRRWQGERVIYREVLGSAQSGFRSGHEGEKDSNDSILRDTWVDLLGDWNSEKECE